MSAGDFHEAIETADASDLDTLAELVAAKITRGLLRMPGQLRDALADAGAGFWANPQPLAYGPNAPFLQAHVKPDIIELVIRGADGTDLWRGVLT